MYYLNTWMKFINNGYLNYAYITIDQRSNSFLENYNRRLKIKLSNFLYGKNKVHITWPIFISFIKNEEKEFRICNYNADNDFEKKNINKTTTLKNNKDSIFNKDKDNVSFKRKFLKWNTNSCRYDSFFFIYCFSIHQYIKNDKLYNDNEIFLLIEKIADILLKANKKKLKEGIWTILEKTKINSCDLTTDKNNYKAFNTILQVINLLKNIDIFCVQYNVYEGCSICKEPANFINYLSPSISITKSDLLNNVSIETLIKNKLTNIKSACINCDYQNDIVVSNDYFKIFSNIRLPKFLFINFDFIENYDNVEFANNLEHEKAVYDLRIQYDHLIYEYLFNDIKIYGFKYELIGLITTPTEDHYTAILFNSLKDNKEFEYGKYYIYNDRLDYDVVLVSDIKTCVLENHPEIGIYVKKTN